MGDEPEFLLGPSVPIMALHSDLLSAGTTQSFTGRVATPLRPHGPTAVTGRPPLAEAGPPRRRLPRGLLRVVGDRPPSSGTQQGALRGRGTGSGSGGLRGGKAEGTGPGGAEGTGGGSWGCPHRARTAATPRLQAGLAGAEAAGRRERQQPATGAEGGAGRAPRVRRAGPGLPAGLSPGR